MLLEVVVFNYGSAIAAAAAGADRLELCDNFYEGGTTPSWGMVSKLKEQLSIPLFPMIRPRGGDFLYSAEEAEVMLRDIRTFKQMGCEGIVTGCLNKNGSVNKELLARLVECAGPMAVTFHRAFDRVRSQLEAMEEVIQCGCQRILTSGGKPFAIDGVQTIRELVDASHKRIGVIPGGGVSSSNIKSLMVTGAIEFHAPARKMMASKMNFCNKEMNESLEAVGIDENEIMEMKKLLKVGNNR